MPQSECRTPEDAPAIARLSVEDLLRQVAYFVGYRIAALSVRNQGELQSAVNEGARVRFVVEMDLDNILGARVECVEPDGVSTTLTKIDVQVEAEPWKGR